jgi:hypothetical protein
VTTTPFVVRVNRLRYLSASRKRVGRLSRSCNSRVLLSLKDIAS